MNKETFAKYISNPSVLDNDTLPEIKAMLDEFPYFQSAWVLYIKNLHAIKDIRYENKLKTASAYISDRKHLHDILKGTYIHAISTVQPQNLVAQPDEIAEDIAIVQAQFIAPQEAENDIVQSQNIVAQPESKEIEDTEIKQSSISATPSEQEMTQDISRESEAIVENNVVETQCIASQEETATVQSQNIVAQPEEILDDSSIVQTQDLASQEEATISQPEENHVEIVQPQNIVAQQEEIPEETTIVQTQNFASQEETPTSPEHDKPESLADRILRQAEEMRRAKAAAAIAPEIVTTQDIASQEEDTTSQPEENSEDIATAQPQNLVAQQEEILEDTPIVQPQNLAAQDEAIISQPEENTVEIATAQPQNIEAQPEGILEDTPIVQAQFIAPQEDAKEEIPKQEEANVKTQNIASQAITPAQIKALLEKQLHDIGINANITISGNSANIQFENIATDEKPEENQPEQPIADNEPSAEIPTTPTIEKQNEKRKNDRNKKANLIDKFIESKARIVPKKDYHSDNKSSTESIIEDEELFTEQLAKIYIKQGHLEKALETYEKLYLKYPEKNIYFATRIEYVKRLIKNK